MTEKTFGGFEIPCSSAKNRRRSVRAVSGFPILAFHPHASLYIVVLHLNRKTFCHSRQSASKVGRLNRNKMIAVQMRVGIRNRAGFKWREGREER